MNVHGYVLACTCHRTLPVHIQRGLRLLSYSGDGHCEGPWEREEQTDFTLSLPPHPFTASRINLGGITEALRCNPRPYSIDYTIISLVIMYATTPCIFLASLRDHPNANTKNDIKTYVLQHFTCKYQNNVVTLCPILKWIDMY
jgi:hypothetical protein